MQNVKVISKKALIHKKIICNLLKNLEENLSFLPANGKQLIALDLLFTSASGLDPHITPAAAEYQIASVAKARFMKESELRKIVMTYTKSRFLNFLGEPTINVLELNLALDNLAKETESKK